MVYLVIPELSKNTSHKRDINSYFLFRVNTNGEQMFSSSVSKIIKSGSIACLDHFCGQYLTKNAQFCNFMLTFIGELKIKDAGTKPEKRNGFN